MASQLRQAAGSPTEIPGPGTLAGSIYRWENGRPVSSRYRLLYCRVFGRPEHELFGGPARPDSTAAPGIPGPADPLSGQAPTIVVVLPPGPLYLIIKISTPGPAADPQPARQLTLSGKASTRNEHPPPLPGGPAAGQGHTLGGRR